jgi:hypothetical protein
LHGQQKPRAMFEVNPLLRRLCFYTRCFMICEYRKIAHIENCEPAGPHTFIVQVEVDCGSAHEAAGKICPEARASTRH